MTFPSPFLAAARLAFISGALAASFSTTTIAGSDVGQVYNAQATHELNLKELENRVRSTRAISVFQKLALQKEVDDLLSRFRNAHTRPNAEVSTLRRPYETLLANIQARLGRDPELVGEIAASREAIWNVLTDRAKFSSL